jgi:hypothetical protein
VRQITKKLLEKNRNETKRKRGEKRDWQKNEMALSQTKLIKD